ncbi:hypothetical protein JTE90_028746 [Oedothorax gibbosus]|uniref:Carbonic anhydrase n=1 Tax=Oedothorax gibbosus TaxID=931172 RepID=A0AAV6UFY1_9ARAC|nr:hypothetical protein JTE90_028746 [Oedothorax gibbosus]
MKTNLYKPPLKQTPNTYFFQILPYPRDRGSAHAPRSAGVGDAREKKRMGRSSPDTRRIRASGHLSALMEWGYEQHNGPDTWPLLYPDAGGSSQSPIDIVSSIVQPRTYDPPLTYKYSPEVCKSIVNTGCGWRVDMNGADSEVSGGPLSDSYEPVQFHCHWGETETVGSEHTVDGKSYAGELHFVHWNRDKYSTCAEALKSPLGLTVIGVLLEEGEKNSELEKLCDVLSEISELDQRVELPVDIDLVNMFPADQSYWTYPGSLTTPPCYESVTWILFKNPITLSRDQLNCFRRMKKPCNHTTDGSQCLVNCNYRPPQALNDREICECLLG